MGNYLSVSKAKESFLDRLKKERENNSIGSKLLEMSMGAEAHEEVKTEQYSEIKQELPVIQREVSSSDESSSEEEEEQQKIPQFVSKKSNNDYPPQKLDKAALDDLKRQQSLKKLSEIHKEKQNAIRNALSSIDSAPRNNKIIFEPPEEEKNESKSKLFDDDEVEEEEIPKTFKVKKQFEGKKGEKLFELQSRFQGDERFTIDEKFAEDADAFDKGKKYTREELRERKKFRKEMQDWDQEGMKEERDHQMDILNSITGETPSIKIDSRPIQKGMLRFDPNKKSHQKYLDIVRGDEELEDEEKWKEVKNSEESSSEDEKSVKQETFFKITENLTFNNSEEKPFSILGMLGIKHDNEEEDVKSDVKEIKSIEKSKSLPFGGTRFRFESSDSDSEKEEIKMQNMKRKAKKSQTISKFGKYSKNGVFHYNLFYRHDDERLKEGFQFLIKTETSTPETAQEKRQKLKLFVKNSVRKAKRDKNNRKPNAKKFKSN